MRNGYGTAVVEAPARQLRATGASIDEVLYTMEKAEAFAEKLANSQFVPQAFRGKPGDIIAAVTLGQMVGLNPMQALQGIAVINGRPCLWGDAALAVVRSHPEFEDLSETFEGTGEELRAVCVVTRRGQSPCSRSFSVAMAKKAGLWQKAGPWTLYPSRMLQMRARGFAIRDTFADALTGMITREEAEDGSEIIDIPVRPSVSLSSLTDPKLAPKPEEQPAKPEELAAKPEGLQNKSEEQRRGRGRPRNTTAPDKTSMAILNPDEINKIVSDFAQIGVHDVVLEEIAGKGKLFWGPAERDKLRAAYAEHKQNRADWMLAAKALFDDGETAEASKMLLDCGWSTADATAVIDEWISLKESDEEENKDEPNQETFAKYHEENQHRVDPKKKYEGKEEGDMF